MVNWDDLRFVLALARSRTLSGASSTLKTTHTTVSRRIRALEERVGQRLFVSDEGGYTPTAAGAHVVRSAERTEAEMHALEAQLLGGDAQLEGKLRVTTMDILFRRYEDVFTSFLERYPGIDLTLSCNDTDASLTRREADVALRMTGAPPPNLVGRKIGRVEFAVYASRRLARRVGARAPLSKWPWLSWDERLGSRWLDTWLAKHAAQARVALRVDMTSLPLREVVASGVGVHFLACTEGDSDPRLVRVGPIATEFSRDIWLLTLDELRSSTRVRAFLDHFVEGAGDRPVASARARGRRQA